MKSLIVKIILIVGLISISIFLYLIFFMGFVLIVRPPFRETEELTLLAMRQFCLVEIGKNLFYSILISTILWFLLKIFFNKNRVVYLLLIIFLFISNLGNFIGAYEYYYGLQSEFKYHF